MAKLGWGTPTLVSAVARRHHRDPRQHRHRRCAQVALPAEDAAIVVLQVSFIGAIEFDKSAPVSSPAVRVRGCCSSRSTARWGCWSRFGADANFVLAVGGFHPALQAAAAAVPGAATHRGRPSSTSSVARIRVEGYFARTSNTVQFGARAEAFFGFSAFNVEGTSSFDALIQFSPFYFIVAISSSFGVKVFGIGVCGSRIRLALEGPTPWRAQGYGRLKLLFFDIDGRLRHHLGRGAGHHPAADRGSAAARRGARQSRQLAGAAAAGRSICSSRCARCRRRRRPGAAPARACCGISQRLRPTRPDHRQGRYPAAHRRARLLHGRGARRDCREAGDAEEQFAAAQFQDFTTPRGSPARLRARGRRRRACAAVAQTLSAGAAIDRNVRYELITVDTQRPAVPTDLFGSSGGLFCSTSSAAAADASPLLSPAASNQRCPFADKVEVTGEGLRRWSANIDNHRCTRRRESSPARRGQEYLPAQLAADPALAGTLHVIPAFELAADDRARVAYTFLPWLRRGIADASTPPTATGRQRARHVRVELERHRRAGRDGAAPSRASARSRALRSRRHRRHRDARDHPRSSPQLDHQRRAQLPGRRSSSTTRTSPGGTHPAAAERRRSCSRLRPWITLVVLEEGEFKEAPAMVASRPLPFIAVRDFTVFPPADELWAWAHVHVNRAWSPRRPEWSSPADVDAAVLTGLADALAGNPDLALLAAGVPAPAGGEHRLPRLPDADVRDRPAGRASGWTPPRRRSPRTSAWEPYQPGRPAGGRQPARTTTGGTSAPAPCGDFE